MILLSSGALTCMYYNIHMVQHTMSRLDYQCKTVLLPVTIMHMCADSLIIVLVFVYSCAAHANMIQLDTDILISQCTVVVNR